MSDTGTGETEEKARFSYYGPQWVKDTIDSEKDERGLNRSQTVREMVREWEEQQQADDADADESATDRQRLYRDLSELSSYIMWTLYAFAAIAILPALTLDSMVASLGVLLGVLLGTVAAASSLFFAVHAVVDASTLRRLQWVMTAWRARVPSDDDMSNPSTGGAD